jgi:lysophospholipase L1-like esterase
VAYPQLIAGSSPNIPSLGTDGFRACSGAVTTNVTDLAQWNESIQLDWWPDATTQVVTLTIGGNDIGFADFAKACVNTQSSCAINSAAYNTALGKINNELPAKLEATYKRILAYAPNAQIYVIGYPQVAPVKVSTDPLDPECIYLADGGTRWSEAQAVRDITTKLNAKVQTKVNDVRAMNVDYQRLHFVEVNGSGSPFSGHEVCGTSGTSFFLNVDQVVNNMAYVFHPNALGQEAYAELVEAAI